MNSTDPNETRGRRSRFHWLALTAAVLGAGSIGVALATQNEPAEPPASAAGATSTPTAGSATPTPSTPTTTHPSSTPDKQRQGTPLPPSRPVSLSIPAIDVDSEVFPIGKADNGTLTAPQPGPNLHKAAWFENSPTPGQPGPSVIEGHVDTPDGPSVFFQLGDLRSGDEIEVAREDGRVAVFTVTELRNFPKGRVPDQADLRRQPERTDTAPDHVQRFRRKHRTSHR